jgi:hypothetical protein
MPILFSFITSFYQDDLGIMPCMSLLKSILIRKSRDVESTETKYSFRFRSGNDDHPCPDGDKASQRHAFLIVHSYAASRYAFADFTPVVVAVNPVKAAARRAM